MTWELVSTFLTISKPLGLSFAFIAAVLLFLTDYKRVARFWRLFDRVKEANQLRNAREQFWISGYIDKNQSHFDSLISVVEDNSDLSFDPNRLVPPRPGAPGGSLHVKVREMEDDTKPKETEFIHAMTLDRWIENRVRSLESSARDSVRIWALFSLIIGFLLQLLPFMAKSL